MLERASMAVAQMQKELQKAGPGVKVQLLVKHVQGIESLQVLLQPDNYFDILATSAQVGLTCSGASEDDVTACSRLWCISSLLRTLVGFSLCEAAEL